MSGTGDDPAGSTADQAQQAKQRAASAQLAAAEIRGLADQAIAQINALADAAIANAGTLDDLMQQLATLMGSTGETGPGHEGP